MMLQHILSIMMSSFVLLQAPQQSPKFGWASSTTDFTASTIISWDDKTGQVLDWNKEWFKQKPTCTLEKVESIMYRVDCHPALDRDCPAKRNEAALKACGAIKEYKSRTTITIAR